VDFIALKVAMKILGYLQKISQKPDQKWKHMRRKTILFFIFLTLVLITNGLPAAVKAGPPSMPSSFYGLAEENGASVPLGTVISAWINGVQYAETGCILYNGISVYSMDVPADDPGTLGITEGGIEGDLVIFKIGGIEANQTGIWRGGTNQALDLSINIRLERIYLPLIIN
jgi:hypothetical protein